MKTRKHHIYISTFLTLIFALASCGEAPRNGLEIKNASAAELTDMKVSITSKIDDREVAKEVETLALGESIVISHDQGDSKVVIEYTIEGKPFKHTDPYVDLWKGQTWLVTIQGGGESESTWR